MTDWVSKVQGALSHLNKVVSIIASLPFIIIMLITVYEVIVRYGFNAPTVWTLEISQYLMLIGTFLAAAYTLALTLFLGLFVLLVLGLPVAFSLGLASLAGILIFIGPQGPNFGPGISG